MQKCSDSLMQTLPLTMREIAAWLRLMSVRELKFAAICDLLTAFGLPEAIFDASREALCQVVGNSLACKLQHQTKVEVQHTAAQAILAWSSESQHHWVTLSDPSYPPALWCLADPPMALYVKGHLEFLHTPAIAIVGSRNASAQGLAHAEQFARALASKGVTIISGLALGIDGAAHRGALASTSKTQTALSMFDAQTTDPKAEQARHFAFHWGSTVAVMGTGIDQIYPMRHRALAQDICMHGAVLSEYALGSPACAYHFPRRNRLIAALSKAVLVVEAAAQSGSLITARLAAELGREVLAIPGSIHSPVSKGCHRLIKEGAKLVESVDDILEELQIEIPFVQHGAKWYTKMPIVTRHALEGPQASLACSFHIGEPIKSSDALSEEHALNNPKAESTLLCALDESVLHALGYDPIAIDVLADRTGLGSATLQAALLHLELQGWVSSLPGGRVMRVGGSQSAVQAK